MEDERKNILLRSEWNDTSSMRFLVSTPSTVEKIAESEKYVLGCKSCDENLIEGHYAGYMLDEIEDEETKTWLLQKQEEIRLKSERDDN